MFSPHTIIYNARLLYIVRHDGADYHKGAPLRVRINLLRYSLTIFPGDPRRWTINKNGWLARQWSNLNWYVWKKWLP